MSVSGDLSHLDSTGQAHMVDVSAKGVTVRQATASAVVRMKGEVLDALTGGQLPKGDALATARIAGIQAAKRTSEWIPLCHPLPLEWVRIEFERIDPSPLEGTKRLPSESIRGAIRVLCTAKTSAKTGVEMEALTGAAAAALTLYDMAKSADKAITIGPIQLEQKTGGKSGSYDRKIPSP